MADSGEEIGEEEQVKWPFFWLSAFNKVNWSARIDQPAKKKSRVKKFNMDLRDAQSWDAQTDRPVLLADPQMVPFYLFLQDGNCSTIEFSMCVSFLSSQTFDQPIYRCKE